MELLSPKTLAGSSCLATALGHLVQDQRPGLLRVEPAKRLL